MDDRSGADTSCGRRVKSPLPVPRPPPAPETARRHCAGSTSCLSPGLSVSRATAVRLGLSKRAKLQRCCNTAVVALFAGMATAPPLD